MNEDSNNLSMCTKQEQDVLYKNFYYDLYNAKPTRSTDWVVKEKLVKEKCCKNSNVTIPMPSLGIQYRVSWDVSPKVRSKMKMLE